MGKILPRSPATHFEAKSVFEEAPQFSRNPARPNLTSLPSLRDFHCEAYGIPVDKFVNHFLKQALYPTARRLYPFLRIFDSDIDKGDRDLIGDLGACTSKDSVRRTLSRLPVYYDDWNFWRCDGKLRVSSRRIFTIIATYKLP